MIDIEEEKLQSTKPLLQIKDLTKLFPLRSGFFSSLFPKRQRFVRAVESISFDMFPGEIFALAGETGSGKTTTGHLIVRLIEPTQGKILFEGEDITKLKTNQFKSYRKRIQIIFQNPYDSLDARQKVFDAIAEPLRIHNIVDSRSEEKKLVLEALALVKLFPPEDFISRYPHELSGGQRQRVSIARALILRPRFLVADEPVSMLDVSIRAGILNFLLEIREKIGLSILFITHDLSVASYIADRIAIMYLGKIMEIGQTQKVINNPLHPYAQALISSVPSTDPLKEKRRIWLKGEPPSPLNPPSGCRFHTRCIRAKDLCRRVESPLVEIEKGHFVACHRL